MESAVESMRAIRTSIGQSKTQISTTVTALNSLVREPQPDLKPQYAKFTEQLALLESQGQSIQKRASSMRQQRDAYLAAWEKELMAVQSEELKAKGVEFLQEPSERPYGVEAVCRDNSGNWMVLVEPAAYSPSDFA